MTSEIKKGFICDVKEAYQESKDVQEWEREYLAELIKELDKIKNLDDKVDCLIYNKVRYVGEDSYWNYLEEEFPKFVCETVKLSKINDVRKFDKEKWIKCMK